MTSDCDWRTNNVKILKFESPTRIIVRFVTWEQDFFKLKDAMNRHFDQGLTLNYCDQKSGKSKSKIHNNLPFSQETIVCVLSNSQWYRGKVIHQEGNLGGRVKVKLVDTGEILAFAPENVKMCPLQFRESRALAFSCHLHGVPNVGWTDTIREKVVNILPDDRIVKLCTISDGKPIERTGCGNGVEFIECSLPCDLTWCSDSEDDPFCPIGYTLNSLVDTCLKFLGSDSRNNFDLTKEDFSEENLEDEKEEFCDIMKLEDSTSFQWLPPQLPDSDEFSARGMFVDTSGQIYIQLNCLRHTSRALGRLLLEKFSRSEPSENDEEDPMLEGQSCCVKWGDESLDGGWFRGKKISHFSLNYCLSTLC